MPTEVGVVRFTDDPITLNSLVMRWDDYPKALATPDGGRLVSPALPSHLGMEKGNYRFVEIVRNNWKRPGKQYDLTDQTITLTATQLIGTRVWTPWDQTRIDSEVNTQRQGEIAAFLADPSSEILYQIAKVANGGTLEKDVFITQVNNWWPQPTLEL